MDEIVKILMRRDNISEEEARNRVDCCRAELHDMLNRAESVDFFTYDLAASIVEDWLGLEPDYLEFLL